MGSLRRFAFRNKVVLEAECEVKSQARTQGSKPGYNEGCTRRRPTPDKPDSGQSREKRIPSHGPQNELFNLALFSYIMREVVKFRSFWDKNVVIPPLGSNFRFLLFGPT